MSEPDKTKAGYVLTRAGMGLVVLDDMRAEHVAAIEELLEPGGTLAAGYRERLRVILLEHYEQQKAAVDVVDDLLIEDES